MAEAHMCQLHTTPHEATHHMAIIQPGQPSDQYEVCQEHGYYVNDCLTGRASSARPPGNTDRPRLEKLRPALDNPAARILGHRIREPSCQDHHVNPVKEERSGTAVGEGKRREGIREAVRAAMDAKLDESLTYAQVNPLPPVQVQTQCKGSPPELSQGRLIGTDPYVSETVKAVAINSAMLVPGLAEHTVPHHCLPHLSEMAGNAEAGHAAVERSVPDGVDGLGALAQAVRVQVEAGIQLAADRFEERRYPAQGQNQGRYGISRD